MALAHGRLDPANVVRYPVVRYRYGHRTSVGKVRPPLRGDAARNARRLIEAGRALLRENPQASAEDIARAADVGAMTLYRRFGTRENLVRAIFLDLFVTEIAPVLAHAQKQADPREGVRIALEGALRTASDHGIPLSAGMTLELADSFVGPVARIVRRGQKQGVIRSDLNAESDTLRLLLMLTSVLPTLRPKSQGWKRYVQLVMDSLTATPAKRLPRAEAVTDPPPTEWVGRLARADTQVWMQVSSVELAAAAVERGVNGLIAQGVEAGGHARGVVPLHELLAQIRAQFPGQLLLAAGGIADGPSVAAALRAGADGVWVGTRLVASIESNAHTEYKRRLIDAVGSPVVTTAFGPEWPGQRYRLLPTRTVVEWAGREDALPKALLERVSGRTTLFPHSAQLPYDMPAFSAIPPTANTTGGRWEEMAYPAGAGVGLIHDVPTVAQIMTSMMSEAHRVLTAS